MKNKTREYTNDRMSEQLVLDFEKIVQLSNQPKTHKIQVVNLLNHPKISTILSCQVIQAGNSKISSCQIKQPPQKFLKLRVVMLFDNPKIQRCQVI